jgi:phosphoribosyl-AMP cyclohydrolase
LLAEHTQVTVFCAVPNFVLLMFFPRKRTMIYKKLESSGRCILLERLRTNCSNITTFLKDSL